MKLSFLAAILLGLPPWANASVMVSRLQSPQVIDGPNNRSDTPGRAFWNGSEFSMYVAGGHTYNMRGADLRSVSEAWDFYADASASLVPGGAGSFDDGGAWLLHAEVAPENTNLVRGWYHAEQCRPGGASNRKTMAYCESTDGGRTFRKVCAADATRNYPNNQFITSWTGYNGNTNQDHTGDGRIARVGDYYYCYFMPVVGGASPHVARSAVADHGRPGTWWKYYDPAGDGGTNGTWSEPGLGGRSSSLFPAVAGIVYGREMTWNDGLKRFMVEAHAFSGFSGIYLAFSTNNLFGWQRAPYPLVVYEGSGGSWNRDLIPATELHAYPGFAAFDGTTDGGFSTAGRTRFGTSFWYVVTYLNPKEGFAERYLLRQKVNLSETASSAPQDQVGRVELALFRHRDGSDDWATTSNTFGHYRKIRTLG